MNFINSIIRIKKQEIGMSPYELFFRGDKKVDEVQMGIIDYGPENLLEEKLDSIDEISVFKNKKSVTWFNINGLHEMQTMQQISDIFELDNLIIPQVLDTQARPKIEEYDNAIFLTIKMLSEDESVASIKVENLSFIWTKSVLLSFQEVKGDVFEPVRERIRKGKRRIRSSGPDYLAFALLDIVIDNYIYLVGMLGEKIEILEDELYANPNKSIIDKIYQNKRKLNFLRKNIIPAREMIMLLSKMESEFISPKHAVHFKELQHNINHVSETCDSYRDILSDQLNIYHTHISSRLNDIMKFLTIFSVIFIPLTFIAGIYGTNFEYLPELHFKYSYFIMWGVMIGLAGVMLIYFKRRKWL